MSNMTITNVNLTLHDLPRKPTERRVGTYHQLNRESKRIDRRAFTNRHRFKMFEQRRPLVPRHRLAAPHHIVPD